MTSSTASRTSSTRPKTNRAKPNQSSTIKKLPLHDSNRITTARCEEPPAPVKTSGQDGASAEAAPGCRTPKGRRFRIPETASCPPAPKKQSRARIGFATTIDSSSSLIRTPITFFASPEIELFFNSLHPETPPDRRNFICR